MLRVVENLLKFIQQENQLAELYQGIILNDIFMLTS
jgi:hypothetical protein